jgi:hypothetical protein
MARKSHSVPRAVPFEGSLLPRARHAIDAIERTIAALLWVLLASCSGRDETLAHRSIVDGSSGSASPAEPPQTDVPDSGNSSPSPDSDAIVPSGLEPRAGECETAADCPVSAAAAVQCLELPGGYRVCVNDFQEATLPSANGAADQCDAAHPCSAGACYETLVYPSGQCGLGGASIQNTCREDECSTEGDCPSGICGPPGLTSSSSVEWGATRQCFPADCRSNDDCTKAAGGICSLIAGSCSRSLPLSDAFLPARLACVYADGCVRNSDCPRGVCTVVDGSAVCIDRLSSP